MILFVNAYAVSRHYGGPEEGGWWYDAGEPLASVPIEATENETGLAPLDPEQAERIREQLRAQLSEYKTSRASQGRYSVLGGDDIEVYIEDHPAQHFPEQRPHYE